ncbi:MAG: glutamate synthase [Bryobacteraceae bacterium]|jgi:glutamate synthase domain-containing protein 1/glutamate synthase domain-containing protein 3
MSDFAEQLLAGRAGIYSGIERQPEREEEGGCGVTGFACSVPVKGRFIYEPSVQMRNRGNGKGGGIAAVGLEPEQIGVSRETLDSHYLLQIALLDPQAHADVEREFVLPHFDVALSTRQPHIDDYRDLLGLEVRPPDVHRYVVRVKPDALRAFARTAGLEGLASRQLEDEFVWRNSYRLNDAFYTSLGEKRAFVLSHGRDQLVFKMVGYAEQNVEYYQLQDFAAHVWIAHQRYPTKGRVWHPGGAHPFSGLNEALVHNGDFANYHSVCEYLRQRNIHQQFLTDTEVSVQLFDLWDRVYQYPLEYIIEALAPTTELDFDQLAPEKQTIYRQIQATHIHASPDGPWFFIIARNQEGRFQLLGITDTAMLRPQVFALSDSGEVQIGLICSEKQAIDATLRSLAKEDPRFCPVADKYWNARGGSSTDGGAFVFTVSPGENGGKRLTCADKFGRAVKLEGGAVRCDLGSFNVQANGTPDAIKAMQQAGDVEGLFQYALGLASWPAAQVRRFCEGLVHGAGSVKSRAATLELLTLLHDRPFDTGDKRRATVIQLAEQAIERLLDAAPLFGEPAARLWRRITWATRDRLAAPQPGEDQLLIDAQGFPPEGDDCDATLLRQAYEMGWRRFAVYRLRGQRFHGAGLGAATEGVRIDLYGSNGDYTASGMDGLELRIHGNAQDQVAQIAKRGKLVIYGDVGQTFMYGAKGGEVYVLGNAAGRPLINAVGSPRVVINGTCLDFLAESFMAGDPLAGGGFVILNGIEFDAAGRVTPQPSPYPGANLFSLASGGAIYIRDPHRKVVERQLNGGVFIPLTDKDWRLIRPYLEENERLFGVRVRDLLTVDGRAAAPQDVYRKIGAVKLSVLAGSEKKK